MNEILQDASNMAIQASEEPIPSSEEIIEHVLNPQPANKTAPVKIGISAASSQATKNTVDMTTASVSATQSGANPETIKCTKPLSIAETLALNRAKIETASVSANQSGAEPKTTKSTKPLSIAETLALNRAKMSARTQRDYSSITSLEDSIRSGAYKTSLPPSQVHPQSSTESSSLSQHIKPGTHSSNLMSVIRQMTNALMHDKRLLKSFNKAGLSSIKRIKNSADDKKFFLECLQTAIQFLHTKKDDNFRIKAIHFIERIKGSIETREQNNNFADFIHTEHNPSETLADNLPPFYDTAFSSLTDLDLSSLQLVFTEVKREVGSSEYLTKLREQNRKRKKKWREKNAERNKDINLRCRVHKRAAAKFGEALSDEKSSWVEKEYLKRKSRRVLKQQRVQANSSDENTGQDPPFVKRITEIIILVFECYKHEDPRSTLMALCAMIATCASQYGQKQRRIIDKRHQLKEVLQTSGPQFT